MKRENPYRSPESVDVAAPAWVSLGLWGIKRRRTAWGYLTFSLVLTSLAVFGFRNPLFFLCAAFGISAIWYYGLIRWMDAHQRWPR